MPRRLFATLLLVTLLPVPAFAQSLRVASERAAATLGRQTTSAPRAAKNPYKTSALALMGAGAGLLAIGLAQDRGAEVSATGTSVSVSEKGGSKTTLTALGLASAGAGAFLWFWGEHKKGQLRPNIAVGPDRISVQSHIQFSRH